MSHAPLLLESLLAARALESAEDRRSVARVALTSFGRALRDEPSDVATADPEGLLAAARFVLDEGLAGGARAGEGSQPRDPPPPAVCAALYEITAALPRGPQRTELGRQVATLLLQGPAPTFAAIATRMARTGGRGLSGAGIEARIALSMFMPLDVDGGIDGCALALATQRDLASTWVVTASTRSLPERRLAARLLLRAVREATRRARRGDREAVGALLAEIELPRRSTLPPPPGGRTRGAPSTMPPPITGSVLAAWEALVGERESAVWRWAAAARGLLAGVVDEEWITIESALDEDAGATAWRRGACALGASIATADDDAFLRAIELARSPLIQRDPGVASAMVWGLAAAADAEPEACEEVLAELAKVAPLATAEPLVDLRREVNGAGDRARVPCRNALTATLERGTDDLGLLALARDVRDDLDGTSDRKLQRALEEAMAAFEWTGAAAAHARAADALAAAEELVARLEQLGEVAAEVRYWEATPLTREVDLMLLESRVLPALLALGVRGTATEASPVQALDDRLCALLLAREAKEEPNAARQPTHHQRNLRALLHLVDVDTTDLTLDERRRDQLRIFWEHVAQATSQRLAAAPGSPLARAVAATLARALDALVRHGLADAADVWLYAASQVWPQAALTALSEASRNTDVVAVLSPGAAFASQVRDGDGEDPSAATDPGVVAARVGALARLALGIQPGVSQGGDHLRRSLGRLARDLGAIVEHPRVELVDSILREVDSLRPLVVAATQRCAGRPPARPRRAASPPAAAATAVALEGIAAWVETTRDLPLDVARLVASALRLAATSAPEVEPALSAPVVTESGVVFSGAGAALRGAAREDKPASSRAGGSPLPPWIPRRRTLGGYFVHQQIGGGAAGSVFLVSRFDEHDDPAAERYALKVPVWDAATSRTLSETEFLRLFRQEASALMEIPEHPNLARFVTFDAGARPKPILVMELVIGDSCDQLLVSRALDVPRALDVLDGLLAGMVAMHAVGVGHLDVKPSNIILRPTGVPVLVDFGLAGRRIRPGCGTVAYGAPEVWLEKIDTSPTATDIYAFACTAFELLTGRPLFDAPIDHAIVAAHLTHDGDPPALAATLRGERLRPIAALFAECLRRAPERRLAATDVRRRLAAHRGALLGEAWPIAASG